MTGIVNAIGRWFGRRSQEQNQEEPSYCWDRLVLVGEDGEQREFRIPAEGFLRIGRNPGNDVMLDDLLVSRWHATVWHEGGRYYLRDEESVNGTCVNGRLVPPGAPSALAQAVVDLLRDPTAAKRMGEAGCARVEEFGARRMVDQIAELYEELLRQKGLA